MNEFDIAQELFGANVFNDKVILEKPPNKVYRELYKTIGDDRELDETGNLQPGSQRKNRA